MHNYFVIDWYEQNKKYKIVFFFLSLQKERKKSCQFELLSDDIVNETNVIRSPDIYHRSEWKRGWNHDLTLRRGCVSTHGRGTEIIIVKGKRGCQWIAVTNTNWSFVGRRWHLFATRSSPTSRRRSSLPTVLFFLLTETPPEKRRMMMTANLLSPQLFLFPSH